MQNFKTVPQRRPKRYNQKWTKHISLEPGCTVTPEQLAVNRQRIAEMEEKVRQGTIQPLVLRMGQRKIPKS